MQIFEVRISQEAINDMGALRLFLNKMVSEEGAVRYANAMRAEINSLWFMPISMLAALQKR